MHNPHIHFLVIRIHHPKTKCPEISYNAANHKRSPGMHISNRTMSF